MGKEAAHEEQAHLLEGHSTRLCAWQLLPQTEPKVHLNLPSSGKTHTHTLSGEYYE